MRTAVAMTRVARQRGSIEALPSGSLVSRSLLSTTRSEVGAIVHQLLDRYLEPLDVAPTTDPVPGHDPFSMRSRPGRQAPNVAARLASTVRMESAGQSGSSQLRV